MKNLFFTLIVLFLSTACKKNIPIVIQAQNHININDGSAYAGAYYKIFEKKWPFSVSPYKILREGYLDDNGKATFDIELKNNKENTLSIAIAQHTYYQDLNNKHLIDEKNNIINFKYATYGHLKFILNNVNCNGQNDTIKFKRISFGIIQSLEGDHQLTRVGCVNTETDFFERPTGDYEYIWEVTRNNVTTHHSQTFSISENEYKVFQLDY